MEPRDTEPSTPVGLPGDFEDAAGSESEFTETTKTHEFRPSDRPSDRTSERTSERRPDRGDSRRSGSRFSESRHSGSRGSGSRPFGSRDSGPRDFSPRDSGEQDFGPPPGYQPIVLPGESLSKYRNRPAATFPTAGASSTNKTEEPTAVSRRFPDDEPEFAVAAGTEEVAAAPTAVVGIPRSEASVRSLETAAYTQPSALYEVEEEEEDDDYPAEEDDEEEADNVRKTIRSKRKTSSITRSGR